MNFNILWYLFRLINILTLADPSINLFKKDELRHVSQISDDEPLYDSVASDDDYAALTPIMVSFGSLFLH